MQIHGTNLPMVSLLMKVAREEGTLYVPRLLSCHCSFHLTAELCLWTRDLCLRLRPVVFFHPLMSVSSWTPSGLPVCHKTDHLSPSLTSLVDGHSSCNVFDLLFSYILVVYFSCNFNILLWHLISNAKEFSGAMSPGHWEDETISLGRLSQIWHVIIGHSVLQPCVMWSNFDQWHSYTMFDDNNSNSQDTNVIPLWSFLWFTSAACWNVFLLGVRALYKGLGPTLVRTFPATGALFLAVETTKKVLGNAADNYGISW